MLDMLDTHTDTDILDTMASVRLMLSLRPRLIPIFCMEVMVSAMLDMPTMDKLITIIVFFFSDHKISVLDFIFGNGRQETQRIKMSE